MKKINKKLCFIIILVVLLACFLTIPMFAETESELKQIFLTREEFNKWAEEDCDETDVMGNPIGMDEYLSYLEANKKESIKQVVKQEMIKRAIKPPDESTTAAP